MSAQFQVGFGRTDITPQRYSPLGGYGDDIYRICTNVQDHTLGTCVAISDENNTILLFTVDLLKGSRTVSEPLQEEISRLLGIPQENVVISGTHTHAGASIQANSDLTRQYTAYVVKQLVKAAQEALADRAPATAMAGEKIVERMTFVRHYLMNDGNYSGPNFGQASRASGYKEHADVADEQLQVVRFIREGAQDIVLTNWQTHATTTGANNGVLTNLSADFVGSMRDHLEGLTGCLFAYFQGACGNLVPGSQIEGETRVERDHIQYGKIMAEETISLLESGMQPIGCGSVRSNRQPYQAEVDRSDDHLLEEAKALVDQYYKTSDIEVRRKLVRESSFNSVHHARGVIRRAGVADHLEMELNALGAGDLGFATAPYEMFCSNGKYVKDNSPYPFTFILTNCNGGYSYLPDEKAFRYDCYEVNARFFYKGVAEDIPKKLVAMLNEIHKN